MNWKIIRRWVCLIEFNCSTSSYEWVSCLIHGARHLDVATCIRQLFHMAISTIRNHMMKIRENLTIAKKVKMKNIQMCEKAFSKITLVLLKNKYINKIENSHNVPLLFKLD